jgi:hypothetical protein
MQYIYSRKNVIGTKKVTVSLFTFKHFFSFLHMDPHGSEFIFKAGFVDADPKQLLVHNGASSVVFKMQILHCTCAHTNFSIYGARHCHPIRLFNSLIVIFFLLAENLKLSLV